MRRILSALALIIWVCMSGASPATALSCTGTFTMEFGDINALDTVDETSTANISVNCTGGTLLATVRACVVIEATRQMTWAGGSGLISYDLSNVLAGGTTWPSARSTTSPSVLITLDLSGAGSGNLAVHGIIEVPQATAPTQRTNTRYTDAPLITVTSDTSATNPNCSTVSANQTITAASVGADYVPACFITTSPLNFGTIVSTTLSQIDASTTINARCSNQTLFTIAMDYGANGGVDPTVRYMKAGSNTLQYGLYLDSVRTQPWGFTAGVNIYSGTGTGSNIAIPVYGRIPAQANPPSGTYTDTVVVTIEY